MKLYVDLSNGLTHSDELSYVNKINNFLNKRNRKIKLLLDDKNNNQIIVVAQTLDGKELLDSHYAYKKDTGEIVPYNMNAHLNEIDSYKNNVIYRG